jgi:hemerythrin superfamily protein
MPTTSNPVLAMLKADHKKVKALFAEYNDATSRKQQEIAQTVIEELDIHAELEEELIYPAIRKGTKDDEVMNEANEEHHLVHVLIAELKNLEPSDDTFKAKFTVLGELVKHHVKEEEGEMFPEAQKAKIDWEALNAEVMERKEHLMAQA